MDGCNCHCCELVEVNDPFSLPVFLPAFSLSYQITAFSFIFGHQKGHPHMPFKIIKRTIPVLKYICIIFLTFLSYNYSLAQAGITWTTQTSAADNGWRSVTYGNGLFVAVSSSGTNKVMTSPDGVTWTSRSSGTNFWTSVTYGNGLFVAVALSGSGNRVMTSPDGITWTNQTSAADNTWNSVTYGNGVFVAVSSAGVAGSRVMTSPDGVTWTLRSSAADNSWNGVIYGNGLFVAVAGSGSGNRVMTSPDGITWTLRSSAADNNWTSITYGNSLFVAVSSAGTAGNRVMTSPDGITWTIRSSAADNTWNSVTYGSGLFVAVSGSGGTNKVMTSPDGITWTIQTAAADNTWLGVTYSSGLFVAVSNSGLGDRVMTSGTFVSLPVQWVSFTAKNISGKHELRWQTANEINNLMFEIERSSDGFSFEKIGEVAGAVNSTANTAYTFTDNAPPAGVSYYRLKQVDADRQFEYSKIVPVNNNQKLSFSFYPNPVSSRLIVSGLSETNKPYSYIITNLTGQTVLTGILPANNTIYTESLSKGWYQLTVNGITRKFVKP
jgi:hypothetical protein